MLAFALILVACAAAAVAYVGWAVAREPASSGLAAPADPVDLSRGPRVVFQHVARDADYATIAVASLARPSARSSTGLVCERVYFAAGRGLCLVPEQSPFYTRYRAKIFGPDFVPRGEIDLAGIPSRARVSSDGRYGATTVFVTGHSYREPGQFSTHTTLIDMRRAKVIADLETFSVLRSGKRFRRADFNFWGVTFARDGNRFYATLATGGKTFLVEGDVGARSARILHENVECPSLSPDGTRVAYKKRSGNGWRLHVLDLDTMAETTLAEPRTVDDQVEWLDDRRVLYGLGGSVWVVPADGSGRASIFLRDALSPAVVRS
jgi:hypothetical protein